MTALLYLATAVGTLALFALTVWLSTIGSPFAVLFALAVKLGFVKEENDE